MAKKKAAKKGGKPTIEGLCVGSKVKGYIKAQGMKSSGDLVDAVNGAVGEVLGKAISRAQENKRSTVRPGDL